MTRPRDQLDTPYLFSGAAWMIFTVATVIASWVLIPDPAIDRVRVQAPLRLIALFAVIAAIYVAGTYCGFRGFGAPGRFQPVRRFAFLANATGLVIWALYCLWTAASYAF